MLTALVVEDDDSLSKYLCRSLEKGGVRAECVNSAEQGVVAVGERPYDFVLLDIVLPGCSGLYVIDAIRRIPAARRPHVVVMTGAQSELLTKIDRGIVKSVMFKPLDVEAVVTFVQSLRRP